MPHLGLGRPAHDFSIPIRVVVVHDNMGQTGIREVGGDAAAVLRELFLGGLETAVFSYEGDMSMA
jgi:hypothetical protein